MMIPDGFVNPVGYSQADSNSCVDPCRVFHCDGNCFAFLTVFWKPTGTKQTDRNLPVSGSETLRRSRQPTTGQSRHSLGSMHAENLLLIRIKKCNIS